MSRTTSINRSGRLAKVWKEFRDSTFEKEKDEEGLIKCQDWKIGLPRCGIALPNMDLHHIEGRDGKLLTDRSKMVWLTRKCHRKIHGTD